MVGRGRGGGSHGFKNLQNCLAQVLEIWYVALANGPLPSKFKLAPGVQNGPALGGLWFEPPKFMHGKYSKIIFRSTWLKCLKFEM